MNLNKIYRFLAFDFGAESGRAILGVLDCGRLSLHEIHRFPTRGLILLGTRQWDITRLYDEMIISLRKCAREYTPELDGIGVDTWGVDFGLIASDGTILGNPVHYRDKRNDGAMERAFQVVPADEIYSRTGIQFLPFNTAFQLHALASEKAPILKAADKILLMADLFAYMICGKQNCEYTNASTTQLLNANARTWDYGLAESLGISRSILPDISPPGTVIGELLPEIVDSTGLAAGIPVIAPATHDTAAAVAAVPVQGESDDWAYLSSGTWSLLGAELKEPLITPRTRELNFTNEGGVGGTIRFLKNIIGLWIIQECRRTWASMGDERTYAELMEEASAAEPFVTIIDVDDMRLLAPGNMPETIRQMAEESGQPVPQTRGAMIRCVVESLALKYRKTLHELQEVTGRSFKRLHVIGGGSQNELLCAMTASACGIPLLAGPVEATAIGNVIVQALGLGVVKSLDDARQIVRQSFTLKEYLPSNSGDWDTAMEKLASLPVS